MTGFEGALTPAAVVEKLAFAGITISERTLRERARSLGAFRQIGRAMFFMPDDIETLLEAAKPQPKKSASQPAPSRWTEDDTEALIARVSPKSRVKRS